MPRGPHPALALPRPQVFAHRGGSALRPENTLAAFDHGVALGADGFEFDVRLSRDGVVVVHHDATLERTTNGHGPLAALAAAELARLDAAYRFQPRVAGTDPSAFPFRGRGFGVPTLREVLHRYPDAWVIIELKQDEPELARGTIDEIRAAGALERAALGSFGSRVLRAARAYEPRILTGSSRNETRLALYRSWCRFPVRHPAYDAFQVPEVAGGTRVVSPRFVRDAHARGLAVQVWTVDEAPDIKRLLGWGVNGIISDRPDTAVGVIQSAATSAVRHDA